MSPRLREEAMLAQYADDTYFEGSDGLQEGYSDYAEQERSLRPTFARFLHKLKQRGMTGGNLLEVGCGYGYLMDEACDYFDYRMGTDFSAAAVERAKAHADHVVLGGIDAVDPSEGFDCIAAVEVIEHIYDPNHFISELYRRLRPGGWLIMATPDMGSYWRKVMQKRWPSFKLPEHVTYYDSNTLGQLYRQAGFERTEKLPFPHAFPLAVLLEKLGMGRLPAPKMNIWLPGVVLAMAARKPI
ncbi:MAG TPA: class I SAM-dependent methyltransferase [Mariprofundaceae bacterium]|nr:class I SAM-dependent methyltransferase [Mariprofundaceae bacterium]